MADLNIRRCTAAAVTHPCAADRNTVSPTAGESCW
jgi:hypothetical protein